MGREIGYQSSEKDALELGVIICKHCSEIIGTLPMDGYKKVHGICPDLDCMRTDDKRESAG